MSARRRHIRQILAAVAAVTALSPSVAAGMPTADVVAPSASADQGRSDAAWRTSYEPATPSASAAHGRSDAAWRAADEPATPTTVIRTISDDGTDLVPALPVGIVLILAAGGAGFTLVRMNRRRPGLSL